MADVTIYGEGTEFLPLPPFEPDSITAVTSSATDTIPLYIVASGMLIAVDRQGRRPLQARSWRDFWGAGGLVWQRGVPYTVSATFPIPAVTSALIATLRRLIAEPTEATYTDALLARYLERYPVSGTFDVYGAAADLMVEKAAALAGESATQGGTVQSLSDQGTTITYATSGGKTPLDHHLALAAQYRSLMVRRSVSGVY